MFAHRRIRCSQGFYRNSITHYKYQMYYNMLHLSQNDHVPLRPPQQIAAEASQSSWTAPKAALTLEAIIAKHGTLMQGETTKVAKAGDGEEEEVNVGEEDGRGGCAYDHVFAPPKIVAGTLHSSWRADKAALTLEMII